MSSIINASALNLEELRSGFGEEARLQAEQTFCSRGLVVSYDDVSLDESYDGDRTGADFYSACENNAG